MCGGSADVGGGATEVVTVNVPQTGPRILTCQSSHQWKQAASVPWAGSELGSVSLHRSDSPAQHRG